MLDRKSVREFLVKNHDTASEGLPYTIVFSPFIVIMFFLPQNWALRWMIFVITCLTLSMIGLIFCAFIQPFRKKWPEYQIYMAEKAISQNPEIEEILRPLIVSVDETQDPRKLIEWLSGKRKLVVLQDNLSQKQKYWEMVQILPSEIESLKKEIADMSEKLGLKED